MPAVSEICRLTNVQDRSVTDGINTNAKIGDSPLYNTVVTWSYIISHGLQEDIGIPVQQKMCKRVTQD